jgi:hypothetical protein
MRIALAAALVAGSLAAIGSAHAADAPPPPKLVAPNGEPLQRAPAAPPSAEPRAGANGAGAASAPVPRALPAAASGVASSEPRLPGEPEVKHIVIEDDGSRIDELRVRGVPQRIVVTSKVGGKTTTYEIITGDGSRDLSPGANTSRGATGQRVWRVLDF